MNKLNPKERFAALFKQVEESPGYSLEGVKIEIAEQIYLAMEAQQVSQAELARRLGTSRAYVTKILQGNVNFTLQTLANLAQALECDWRFNLSPKHLKAARKRETSATATVHRRKLKKAA